MLEHRLEALGIEEGISATPVPIKGFGYLTGYKIGLKPVVRYPAKHANHLDSWSDDYDEIAFNNEELNVLTKIRGRYRYA